LHRLAAAHGIDRLFQVFPGGARLLEQPAGFAFIAERREQNSSDAINWSPRFCASLSVRLSRLVSSRETLTSPPWPSTLGRRSMACLSAALQAAGVGAGTRQQRCRAAIRLVGAARRAGAEFYVRIVVAHRKALGIGESLLEFVVNLSKRMVYPEQG